MALQGRREEPPEVLDVDDDRVETINTRSSMQSAYGTLDSIRGSEYSSRIGSHNSVLRSSLRSSVVSFAKTSTTDSSFGRRSLSSAVQEMQEDDEDLESEDDYFSSDSEMIMKGQGSMGHAIQRTSTINAMTKAMRERWEARESKEKAQDFLTNMTAPPWFDMVLAATGIANLTFRIDKERERRQDPYFVNPYPVIHGIVLSTRFEVAVACAIVANCSLIGWEASVDEGTLEGFFGGWEHFFTLFFFFEWCMRVLAFGWIWVFEFLNFCDTFIVFATGVLVKWVMEPAGSDMTFIRCLTVLRTIRLARLVQSVRHVSMFRDLWVLIKGLSKSMRPLFWMMIIGLIILYVGAVAATELIGRRDVFQDDDYVQRRFGNLLRSMSSMMQLLTLDNWGFVLARPAMKKDSSLIIFFIGFVGVGAFVFWNLITAIIIETAHGITKSDSAQLARDADQQKRHDLRVLSDLFLEMDKDGSGELSSDEFLGALQNPKVRHMLDALQLSAKDLQEVWILLDDGDGLLTIKEFTNGMRRMKGEAKAKDVVDTIKRLRHTALGQAELEAQAEQFGVALDFLEDDIRSMARDTGEVVGLFQEMYHRLQVHLERTAAQDRKAKRLKAHKVKEQELAEVEAELELEENEFEDD